MKKLLNFLLVFVFLNFTSLNVFAYEDPIKIVKEIIPLDLLHVGQEKPFSPKPILLYDFDKDGEKEIIVTFEIKAKEQPSPSIFGVMVFKKGDTGWEKIWETKMEGVDLDFSELADITGNGTKEYLFGVTIGAALGSKLVIFEWIGTSFKKITDLDYHKIELVNGNQNVGIAIWKMYVNDSYLVDVLKWNGNKLIYDEELYIKYYPKIENFYKNKISEMDAWFFWYCLADSQIKANLFEEASKSIEHGITLAKKIPMPDVVQNFNKLSNKLEEKKY